MANIMLGKATEYKLSQIPLSNDTISNRIDKMSDDILAQIVSDLISSPAKFSFQLDENTDDASLSQLAVFVCYVKEDVIKEDSLLCQPPTTSTKTIPLRLSVRASASQSVDLGFISLVESYQKTLKNGIHSFPAGRSANKG